MTSIEFAKADANGDGKVDNSDLEYVEDITPVDLLVAAIVKYHVDSNSVVLSSQSNTYDWIKSQLDSNEEIMHHVADIPEFEVCLTI